MKFGCCIKKMEEIEKLKIIGYDGYEYSGAELSSYSEEEFAAMERLAEKSGFPCLGINAYSNGIPAFVGFGYSACESEEYAKKVCKRAHALGAKKIGIGSPKARHLPEKYESNTAMKQFEEFLTITAEVAGGYGIAVMLEPLRKSSCNFINTAEEALSVIRTVGTLGIKMVYDFYHMKANGNNYIKKVGEYKPYIDHVHISTEEDDGKRGFPIEADVEEYRDIFGSLRKIGYDDVVSIEPSGFHQALAARSLKMLKGL